MRWRKSAVYDAMHKTTVTFLMGFSALCSGYIVYCGLRWYLGMNLSALFYLFMSNLHCRICHLYNVAVHIFA